MMSAIPRPPPRSELTLRSAAAGILFLSAASVGASSHAQTVNPTADGAALEALNQRINEQVRRMSDLRRKLEAEESVLQEMRRAVAQQLLASPSGQGTSRVADSTSSNQSLPVVASSTIRSDENVTNATIAPIFEEPGVLTPAGHSVLEPSLQYSYSSNNRVTLLGYTILPALVVGLVDVREVKRNTVTSALGFRYGVTSRLEVEARAPYIYRSDSTVSRPYGAGSATDTTVNASGRGIGDVELAARYQITNGLGSLPIMIGSLRFKSRTGTDPFEVVTDCNQTCVGNATGTGQPLELPTGSGFYSLQPGLTWLLASDPAVLFGSFSYLHNFARSVSRRVLNGDIEPLGRIAPGDVLGFNVGIGLALNDKSSFSVGYDQSSVAATRQNGQKVEGSVRTQLSTLLFGYSYRLDSRHSLNFSVGAGLTADTPGVTLGLRMPISF